MLIIFILILMKNSKNEGKPKMYNNDLFSLIDYRCLVMELEWLNGVKLLLFFTHLLHYVAVSCIMYLVNLIEFDDTPL